MKGLLLTYAMVVFGTVGALRNPLIGLAIYILFAVLRPQYMWGWATDLDGISWLVGVATLLSWAARGFGSWRFGRARAVVGALGVYAVWSALSALQAANGTVAWAFLVNLAKVFLPFLVGVTMIRSEEWGKRILWVIILSQGYVAYHLNLRYLQGFNEAHQLGYGGMDNNSIAIALVSTLGPAIAMALYASTWRARAVAAAASALIMHASLLTFSRGGMVALIVSAVTLFALIPKHPKHLAFATVAVLVTLRLTGPELAARYQTAFAAEDQLDSSAASRFDLWRDTFAVAVQNPAFGIGPDHWPLVAQQYGWPVGKEAHSVWMQAMAELGFPGATALFLVFGFTVVRLWPIARMRGRDPAERERAGISLGVIMGAVGYAVSAQFVSLEGLEAPYYIVMCGAGLLATLPARALAVQVQPVRQAVPTRTAPRPILAHARRVRPNATDRSTD